MNLGYNHFFDNESQGYNNYIEKISSQKVITLASIINNQYLFKKQNDIEVQKEIINKLLVSLNNSDRNNLYNIFNYYFQSGNNQVITFNVIANLKIIERELSEYREIDDSNLPDNEIILSFLKAYLCINDEINLEQNAVFSHDNYEIETETLRDKAFLFILPAFLHHFEIPHKYDLLYQIRSAIAFFKYAEGNNDLNEVLKRILSKNGTTTWRDYIIEIFDTLEAYNQVKDYNNLFVYDCDSNIPKFITSNSHLVNKNPQITHGRSGDFKFLREMPIIQFKKNEFLISYIPLLVDKLYQGFKFDFVREMMKLPKYQSHKKPFGICMSDLSTHFSHKFFEETMKYCFRANQSMTLILDKELDNISDAYIREGNVVYLFEFKDEIIQKGLKNSSSFEEVKAGFFEKFVYNKKENKKKAVHQLSDAIEKFAYKITEYDKALNKETKITYVPVIVYTDMALDFPGINRMLNNEFKIRRKEIYKKLNLSNRGNVKVIKDLAIINFRIFVEYKESFKAGKINFKGLLDHLDEQIKINNKKPIKLKNDILDSLISSNQILLSFIEQKCNINKNKNLEEDYKVLFGGK